MIYFTNTETGIPHMVFIGRWSPFHIGHTAIIEKKRREHPDLPVLIMVRDRKAESYPATVRAEYVRIWMTENGISGTIMIIPDIEGVYWGRTVGYNVGMIDADDSVKRISGSQIRSDIQTSDPSWKNSMASRKSADFFSARIAEIVSSGLVVWLTGSPSSGKTTIAQALIATASDMYPYLKTQLLDGDIIRSGPLGKGSGFSPGDRALHIIRMGHLAKMFADHGIFTVCAFVSPDRKIRKQVKTLIGKDRFIEVYVRASMRTRIMRDTKGLYKQAQAGKIKNLTGMNAPYQVPVKPQITCDTERYTVEKNVSSIIHTIFR